MAEVEGTRGPPEIDAKNRHVSAVTKVAGSPHHQAVMSKVTWCMHTSIFFLITEPKVAQSSPSITLWVHRGQSASLPDLGFLSSLEPGNDFLQHIELLLNIGSQSQNGVYTLHLHGL